MSRLLFDLKLRKEAAAFTRIKAFAFSIVQQVYILCPHEQVVKVVAVYGIFLFISGQPQLALYIIRYKGILRFACGQLAFVDRCHDHVLKIEYAALQHPHNLEARERLALK